MAKRKHTKSRRQAEPQVIGKIPAHGDIIVSRGQEKKPCVVSGKQTSYVAQVGEFKVPIAKKFFGQAKAALQRRIAVSAV